jgi:hypothetical protein
LDYLNCSDNDLMLVEFSDKKNDFLFEKKNIEFKEGVCPGCDDKMKKLLMRPCSCKEV